MRTSLYRAEHFGLFRFRTPLILPYISLLRSLANYVPVQTFIFDSSVVGTEASKVVWWGIGILIRSMWLSDHRSEIEEVSGMN